MYAIVDIETTGGHATGNGMTEVAIFIHDGNGVVDKFHSLINPQQKIPTYITALTGISNAMVASAPSFEEIAADIFALLEGHIFVAHNVNFDYSFLKHHLKNCGFSLSTKKLCTVRLGRKVFPGLPSYSLGNFCWSMNAVSYTHLDVYKRQGWLIPLKTSIGHSQDENQVSNTSSSCVSGLASPNWATYFLLASASLRATTQLPCASYQAGMRCPHQSWRLMHQSLILPSQCW